MERTGGGRRSPVSPRCQAGTLPIHTVAGPGVGSRLHFDGQRLVDCKEMGPASAASRTMAALAYRRGGRLTITGRQKPVCAAACQPGSLSGRVFAPRRRISARPDPELAEPAVRGSWRAGLAPADATGEHALKPWPQGAPWRIAKRPDGPKRSGAEDFDSSAAYDIAGATLVLLQGRRRRPTRPAALASGWASSAALPP